MGEGEPQVSVKPLADWLNTQPRGTKAALARHMGVSAQVITNWLKRKKIPAHHVPKVAEFMRREPQRYLDEAGASHIVISATPKSGGLIMEKYIDDDKPSEKHGRIVKPLAAEERETLDYLRRSEPPFRRIADAFLNTFRAVDSEMSKHGRDHQPGQRSPKKSKRRKGAAGSSS